MRDLARGDRLPPYPRERDPEKTSVVPRLCTVLAWYSTDGLTVRLELARRRSLPIIT